MALYTQARRRGQMLSNRRRRNVPGGPRPQLPGGQGTYPNTGNHIPSGQSPPIVPGQTVPTPQHDNANAYGYSPIHYGALGKQVGIAKVGQARNQPGFIPRGQRAGGTPGYPGGNPALPGETMTPLDPNAYNPHESWAEYQARVNNRGANATITPEQLAQYGSYAAAIRANGAANFDINEWAAMPDAQLQTALTNAFNHPGPLRNVGDAGMEQLRQLAAQRGIALPQSTGSSPVPGARANPITNYDFGNRPLGSAAPQLGSDGQYHDPNAPLPPGVELKPPEGATAPQTQPVSAIAEAAHGTPQAAINAGKDPTKHLAYWEDKGWTYNPATDKWTNHNAAAAPAATAVTQAAAPVQAGAAAPTMPLDPAYIAAQRAAQLQLNSTLQGTYPALEQINAQNQLALARMQTNQGVDTQALMEALASRGALQSSIYGTERGNLATNYLRTGQDLAADVANAQSTVYQTQQSAYNDYYAALIEALLASANNSATSEYTPVGNVGGGGGGNTTNRGKYATPMAARRAGEDPLKKKAYWKSKGWVFKNGKWVKKGDTNA